MNIVYHWNLYNISNNLYLNYHSPRGVNLCNGGGTVQIGPYTTGDTGNNKLFVNGSEFI